MARDLPVWDPRFARLRLALCPFHGPGVDLDAVALRVYRELERMENIQGPPRPRTEGTGDADGAAGKESLP